MLTATSIVLLALGAMQGKQCTVPKQPNGESALRMVLKVDLTVLDSKSVPVPNASVTFVDVAPPLAERDAGRLLGATGADGRMTAEVTHQWTDYFRETRRPDSGAFAIVIDAPNGEQVVRNLVVECLPRVGDRFSAQLRILLARTRDSIIIY